MESLVLAYCVVSLLVFFIGLIGLISTNQDSSVHEPMMYLFITGCIMVGLAIIGHFYTKIVYPVDWSKQ